MTGLATIVFSARLWLVPALVLTIAAAAALIWAGHRSGADRRVQIGCGLLKLAGIMVLALCLLEPLRVTDRAKPGANYFAIMADNSQSLQIKDAGQTQTRGEMLRQQLTADPAGWQNALGQNFQVRRYLFDSRLQDVRDFGDLNFQGRASALGNSLRSAAEQWRGQPVAGVFLFSDGNATDMAGDLSVLDGSPPIYPIVMGEDSKLRDISLDKVTVTQTAFEDAPVTVQAEVGARGFSGAVINAKLTEIATETPNSLTNQTGPVELRVADTNHIVAEQRLAARDDDSSLNFRFQVQPDKPGLHFYELEATSAAGGEAPEATLLNNRQILVVDRGQEPFRILYVSGRPNWEYKFLNRGLQDDPQVQVVALIRVARREPKFKFKARNGDFANPMYNGFIDTNEETARYDQPVLIHQNTKDEYELRAGFPQTAEELFGYSAVIIGDMESEFFTHDQMDLLQRFVSQRGGGFLMIGSAQSFRAGHYEETPVGSMLPVYLDQAANAKLPSTWKLNLTREGWLQPWVRLRATEEDEQARLEPMTNFTVLNAVRGVKPGATVLATVSDDSNHSFPALAVEHYGLGRTAATMVGDMWLWGMQGESYQKDLQKSWRQLLRWLVADVPSPVAVAAEPGADGDPTRVRLVVKARDKSFLPVNNANVQLTVRPVRLLADDASSDLTSFNPTNFVRIVADASATDPGTYEASYVAHHAGAYVVEAHVSQPDGTWVGQSAAGWAVDPAAQEFRSLKPNRDLLESIARRTGGAVLTMDALPAFVKGLPDRHAPVTEPFTDPLWQKPYVFLFAVACFVAEWGVRRWKGLP